MSNNIANDDEDYTVEELLEMSAGEFKEAVTEDLNYTGETASAFQDKRVVGRTLDALRTALWNVDQSLERNKNNLEYSDDKWDSAAVFRRLVIFTLNVTQNRVENTAGTNAQIGRMWRSKLHAVLDEIEGSELDHLLDDMRPPFTGEMTLREWLLVRRAKDPHRIPERHEGERAA